MAEEISRELIQEIVQETIQTSTQPLDTSWVPIVGVIVSIGVLAFSVLKFAQTQKQHHDAQEKAQKEFNETQEKTKNLEFIKQLEYYEENLMKIGSKTLEGPAYFVNYKLNILGLLTILDRIAYLREKNLIDDDFIDYFEFWFNEGRTALTWLKFMGLNLRGAVKHFDAIKDNIDYSASSVRESPIQQYYRSKKEQDKNYDPTKDYINPEKPD